MTPAQVVNVNRVLTFKTPGIRITSSSTVEEARRLLTNAKCADDFIHGVIAPDACVHVTSIGTGAQLRRRIAVNQRPDRSEA